MGTQRMVLVVEDESAIRDLLKSVLEDDGYVVATATNGMEALEHYTTHLPDLILLDLMMPVMDGATFYRMLAARPGQRPPVIVISAGHMASQQAGALGANAFLAKPFELDTLLDMVEQYAPIA